MKLNQRVLLSDDSYSGYELPADEKDGTLFKQHLCQLTKYSKGT